MAKNIEINITKQVHVQNSPFKIIIYILKDANNILVEDVDSGKSILTSSYNIKNYIELKNQDIPWTKIFNHQYIKIEDKYVSQFMPLYFEKNKFATLTFRIDKEMAPKFKTKDMEYPHPNHNGIHARMVRVIDNSLDDPDETSETNTKQTYNYFYGNIKDFEIENFKLEMIAAKTSRQIYDENFEYLKIPHITCRLPMFQLYSILRPIFNTSWTNKTIYNYENERVFMKIDNKFYRFPYGNSSADDKICLGSLDKNTKKQPESIEEIAYVHLISTEANGDYVPHVKHDNTIITTFDIEWIREKVNRNDFTFSYMDALFYLSQCKSARDVNINIFLLSVQVPPEILKFEGVEDQAAVREEAPIDDDIPTGETTPEAQIVIPRAEFTSTTLVRQDGTIWLARVPIELMHQRYDPNNLDPRIQFISEVERADFEDNNGNIVFPPIEEEQVNTEYRAMAVNNATTTDWMNVTATTGAAVYAPWTTTIATAVGDVIRREVVTGIRREQEEANLIQTEQGEVETTIEAETELRQLLTNIQRQRDIDALELANRNSIRELVGPTPQAEDEIQETMTDLGLRQIVRPENRIRWQAEEGSITVQQIVPIEHIEEQPEVAETNMPEQRELAQTVIVLEDQVLEILGIQETNEPVANIEITNTGNYRMNEVENAENQ